MKQYYLIVLVLLINLTIGNCNDCEENGSVMIETTPRTDELDELPTEPTTVADEEPAESTTLKDEEPAEPTTISDEETTESTTVVDEETTESTTVADEETTESTTVADEETTVSVTVTEKTTTIEATTTKPVTAPNNPCETTTTCAPTKKSTDINTIRYFVRSSDCASLKSGTILVDANHCRRYYLCASGKAKRYRCPVGNWYDRQKLTCRSRTEVNNCPANRN